MKTQTLLTYLEYLNDKTLPLIDSLKLFWWQINSYLIYLKLVLGIGIYYWNPLCIFAFWIIESIWKEFNGSLYFYSLRLRNIIMARTGINQMIDTESEKIIAKYLNKNDDEEAWKLLPQNGIEIDEVKHQLDIIGATAIKQEERKKVSGMIYHADPNIIAISGYAMKIFMFQNALHFAEFSGPILMENRLIHWTLDLFNCPSNMGAVGNPSVRSTAPDVPEAAARGACQGAAGNSPNAAQGACAGSGLFTSGGTTSILLACLAHRNWATDLGINHPNLVIPSTAHPAFNKAGDYFNIEIRRVPVGKNDGKANVELMKKAIDRNTIALVGSAPSFPWGIVDPMLDLSAMAFEKGIGMIADCCLGSYLIPFSDENKIGTIDFLNTGVSCITCDLHKFGYTVKGASLVLFRQKWLRNKVFFLSTDWQGGEYVSRQMQGSETGALVAAAYGAFLLMGKDGLKEKSLKVLRLASEVKEQLQQINEIQILGDPHMSVVAFKAKTDLKTYLMKSALEKKGYHLSPIQNPPGLHVCLTDVHDNEFPKMLANDLIDILAKLETEKLDHKVSGKALYGASEIVPNFISQSVAKKLLSEIWS